MSAQKLLTILKTKIVSNYYPIISAASGTQAYFFKNFSYA
jgi:hypothetical protein